MNVYAVSTVVGQRSVHSVFLHAVQNQLRAWYEDEGMNNEYYKAIKHCTLPTIFFGLLNHASNHKPKTKFSGYEVKKVGEGPYKVSSAVILPFLHELWVPQHDVKQHLSCAVTLFTYDIILFMTSDEHIYVQIGISPWTQGQLRMLINSDR